jgi:hypothetical protein
VCASERCASSLGASGSWDGGLAVGWVAGRRCRQEDRAAERGMELEEHPAQLLSCFERLRAATAAATEAVGLLMFMLLCGLRPDPR